MKRAKCGDLYLKNPDILWILDDAYFTLSHSTFNGNSYFYSSDISTTPASIKYNRPKQKYEAKLLVWICMSEISSPIFLRKRLCSLSIDFFEFHQA